MSEEKPYKTDKEILAERKKSLLEAYSEMKEQHAAAIREDDVPMNEVERASFLDQFVAMIKSGEAGGGMENARMGLRAIAGQVDLQHIADQVRPELDEVSIKYVMKVLMDVATATGFSDAVEFARTVLAKLEE